MTTHVDDPTGGGRRPVGPAREELVVARLRSLGAALDGGPDPDHRAATRARLVAMAAVRTPVAAPSRRRLPAFGSGRVRPRLTAGLAAAALAVTALATVVAVATGAGPGDLLYGVKRGTEQTRLALAGDARGQTLLDLASTRLGELDRLVGRPEGTAPPAGSAGNSARPAVPAAGASPDLVVSTLRTMDRETADGAAWLTRRAVETGNDGPVRALAGWTQRQSSGLARLVPAFPAGAAGAAGNARALLTRIAVRTAVLGPALSCASGPAVAAGDDLGPVPAACTAAAPSGSPSPSAGGPGRGGPSAAQVAPAIPSPGAAGRAAVTGAPVPGGGAAPATPPPGGRGLLPTSPSPGGGHGPGTSPTAGAGSGFAPPVPSLPVPSLPVLPVPTIPPLPSPVPPLPVPGVPGTGSPTAGTPPGVGICLPPLVTVGSC